MSFVAYLLSLTLTGAIVGPLARLSLPGRDPMTVMQTLVLGVVSAWIAGTILWFATDGTYVAGIPASALVGSVIVYVIRRRRGGDLVNPGRPGGSRERR